MKKLSKVLGILLSVLLVMSLAACQQDDETNGKSEEVEVTQGGNDSDLAVDESKGEMDSSKEFEGGTIMWLSSISSGIQYEGISAYAEAICEDLGYDFQIVYGDMFNDPAGNLNAVKNAMTKDVVGIAASQDGGIKDIMAEYPDLFIAGFNDDMRSVFFEDGNNAEVFGNDHFLGTIVDGNYNGAAKGKRIALSVIEKGYKKVSTVIFPYFAYPTATESDVAFRATIDEYNTTAAEADKIEVVGDTKVLEFQPLDETFFLEEGRGGLDAVVAFCAGLEFVYPTMVNAISNGSCSPDTKLVTSGFTNDEAVVADTGNDGVIQYIQFSPDENIAWAIIMIDNAFNNVMYSDFNGPEPIDSIAYVIDSKEDMDNVVSSTLTGTADFTLAQLSLEEVRHLLVRFNLDATYADLLDTFSSDQLTVESLMNKE